VPRIERTDKKMNEIKEDQDVSKVKSERPTTAQKIAAKNQQVVEQ